LTRATTPATQRDAVYFSPNSDGNLNFRKRGIESRTVSQYYAPRHHRRLRQGSPFCLRMDMAHRYRGHHQKGVARGKFIDLIGQQFGDLLVLRLKQRAPIKWECQCVCGNIVCVITADLRKLHTRSCGCLQRKAVILSNTTHGQTHTLPFKLWLRAKRRAKDSNAEFSITPFDVKDVWPTDNKCPILGITLECNPSGKSGPQRQSPSLDRIDSTKGYVKGNIAVISYHANLLKSNESNPAVFEALARWLRGTRVKAVGV
jgi:hypothetical protein